MSAAEDCACKLFLLSNLSFPSLSRLNGRQLGNVEQLRVTRVQAVASGQRTCSRLYRLD